MALRAVAQPASKQWGVFGLSTDQTAGLTFGSPIRFDTVTAGTLGLGSYTITLPAGRTFRLAAALSCFFSAGYGALETRWFNVSTGSWIGRIGHHIPPTNPTPWSDQPLSHAIVSTSAGATAVQLRFSGVSSLGGVFSSYSFAEIFEVP